MKLKIASNYKMQKFSIGLSLFVLFSSVLFVRPGIWLNTFGVLTSPPGIVSIIVNAYENADNYVPLDYNSTFFIGVNIERASRIGLTGETSTQYGYYYDQPEVKDELLAATWTSIFPWVSIIATVIYSSKISKLRQKAQEAALPSILGMWSCIVGTLIAAQITLSVFNYINMMLMFIFAGMVNTIIYFYSKFHTTPLEASTFQLPTLSELDNCAVTTDQSPAMHTVQEIYSKDIAHFETRDGGIIVCPICQKTQKTDRNSCFSCGCRFEYGIPQNEKCTTLTEEHNIVINQLSSIVNDEMNPRITGAAPKELRPLFCRKCGASLINEESTFCINCGIKVVAMSAPTKGTEV